MILDMDKGLSTGEKKMLNSATQMLYSEMVLASDKTVEEVETLVEETVKAGYTPQEVEE